MLDETELLLQAGATPHATTFEDLVTSCEPTADTLGARHSARRDYLTISWLKRAVEEAVPPRRVLDIGCSYGNHLFKLNAALGKPHDVEMIGIDLHELGIQRATAFARCIPGYNNCLFRTQDLAVGLPFDDGSFCAVTVADVLEHVADPDGAVTEIARVAAPGATIVISTPLRDSLFKRLAEVTNRLTAGRLYERYYGGKGAALDEEGQPTMDVFAGRDHVSEMTLPELEALLGRHGLSVERVEPMSVMSGSRWFDEHAVMLAALLVVEALHERLRRPSWAHSVMLQVRRPGVAPAPVSANSLADSH